jgi:hypothetical protein
MASAPDYSFVFVCQQGDLEIKAMLLAASLKRFVSCPYDMVVAIPQPESQFGRPRPATLRMLQDLGAQIAPIWNRVDPAYPIGNKISALGIPTAGRRRIFLDSDIMCSRPFPGDPRLEVAFGATPAAMLTWGRDVSDWDRVYGLFGLTTPELRVKTLATREETAPYYNAGFLVAGKDVADQLSRVWLDCARTIDEDPAVPNKRPWLDQIALPVAVTRMGLPHTFLDETFNCPGSKKLSVAEALPYFCHYHALLPLKRLAALNQVFREVVAPHPILRQRMMEDRLWRAVFSTGFGVLETLNRLKSARRQLAPPGSRRDHATTQVAKRVKKLLRSVRDLRG